MGKGEKDLWDDSALINAFNDAISKYKIKHSQAGGANSAQVNSSAVEDESSEARRHKETRDDSEVLSTKTKEIGETSNTSHVTVTSDIEQPQDKTTNNVNAPSVEDYNSLLDKYYELEDQRQKILQKLSQFGDWSYQNPSYSPLNSEEHQAYAAQTANYMPPSFYCPYGCQSWVSPFMAPPACCVGGNCTDRNFDATPNSGCDQNASLQQPEVVKTAMDSAEKAPSSLREDFGNEGAPETSNGHIANESEPETALSEVLDAWYSAGLYTGKYVSEQSRVGKRHD